VLKHNLKRIKQRVDHAEHGGGLLLGVNGVCIIGHGSSRAPSAFGAIRLAKAAVESHVIERIQAQYQQSVQQAVASEN
jgi:phosphate acyltransferase